jgi:deoxyribodipyrimidine photo-lyase
MKISVFWFRRDLRLTDNTALHHALESGFPVLTIFIFDDNILKGLPADDPRVSFIYNTLQSIHNSLVKRGSSLVCLNGEPTDIFDELAGKYEIEGLYFNKDYEPYAIERDNKVRDILSKKGIAVHAFKDQVIFEQNDVVKDDGKPYTVYTPYRNKWIRHFRSAMRMPYKDNKLNNYFTCNYKFPELQELGFRHSSVKVRDYDLNGLDNYTTTRNFPAMDATSYLGPHLRFGKISIREVIVQLDPLNETFLGELIWREFFMQILYHFPEVINRNFRSQYDGIKWINNEKDFQRWCLGNTGYAMVDAGMRQLNATGYMHNRVRMVAASFLCKHLLIDWRQGESYFAGKLLDYELSSNNGNWQWAAGTGCDAAPYFRIFNPIEQQKRYDRKLEYVRKWIPEYSEGSYSEPMIDHLYARQRALEVYRKLDYINYSHNKY